jgi:auxin-responsive protein IAA
VMQAKYNGNARVNILLSPRPSGAQPTTVKEKPSKVLQESPCAANGTGAPISGSAPAAK